MTMAVDRDVTANQFYMEYFYNEYECLGNVLFYDEILRTFLFCFVKQMQIILFDQTAVLY